MSDISRRWPRRPLALAACLGAAVAMSGCAGGTRGAGGQPPELAALQLQAERGNAGAANALGVLYSNGVKTPQDFAEARKWFQFASDHGNPAGELNLGLLYLNGKGVPLDLVEGVRWIRTAADGGFTPAKSQLGLLYLEGKGVPQSDQDAATWLRAAAVDGMAPAQLILAILYDAGRGVEPDDGLAYEWASLAAARIQGPAQPGTIKLRDAMAKFLPADILAQAQAATTQWKPGQELTSPFPPNGGPRPLRVRGQGSGFVVGKNGEIATDFHVIPNCREVRLKDSVGQFNTLTTVIATDKMADLALLAGGGFGSRLPLRSNAPIQGETVVTYGYPLGQLLSSSGNLTEGSVSSTSGAQGNDKAFQISAPVQPGSSGGPVVDQSGAVIGIVVNKLNVLAVAATTGDLAQNVNFATQARLLRALMDSKNVGYEIAGSAAARSNTQLADILQKATVKVECWR